MSIVLHSKRSKKGTLSPALPKLLKTIAPKGLSSGAGVCRKRLISPDARVYAYLNLAAPQFFWIIAHVSPFHYYPANPLVLPNILSLILGCGLNLICDRPWQSACCDLLDLQHCLAYILCIQ